MENTLPKINRSDLNSCEKHYLVHILADEWVPDRFGAYLVGWFADEMYALRRNSNLGIGIGVIHPSDDEILRTRRGYDEALSFFLDRVEIIEDTKDNVDS